MGGYRLIFIFSSIPARIGGSHRSPKSSGIPSIFQKVSNFIKYLVLYEITIKIFRYPAPRLFFQACSLLSPPTTSRSLATSQNKSSFFFNFQVKNLSFFWGGEPCARPDLTTICEEPVRMS